MSDDQQAEIERLRAENERLKSSRQGKAAMKVSEKGALSVYGMGRFPVTLRTLRPSWRPTMTTSSPRNEPRASGVSALAG